MGRGPESQGPDAGAPVEVWEWEDGPPGSGLWRRYDGEQCLRLAAAAAADAAASVAARMHGADYTIDLGAMRQTRLSMHRPRAIRRRR
jgi:hypothetical protein